MEQYKFIKTCIRLRKDQEAAGVGGNKKGLMDNLLEGKIKTNPKLKVNTKDGMGTIVQKDDQTNMQDEYSEMSA